MLQHAQTILKDTFGYTAFRGDQAAAIACALAGQDSVIVMPTGGGKSLCYQIPALVRDACAVVVSPLIALMQDQVAALERLGVAAASLNSNMSGVAQARVMERCAAGELRLLYVAPERVLQERTLSLLKNTPLALIAIDEAHCVSQWGHDFRAEYLELGQLASELPGVPRMALTATADARTRADIASRLALVDPHWFVGGFDRPNIRYTVLARGQARQQLEDFLRRFPGQSGIVYCMTRNKVEETAATLSASGRRALPYHAGLDAHTRAAHQTAFLRDDGVVMVATIAFGMGIDKPDVRFVAHLDLPKSVEAYYQETGRAGRDGEPAEAWMVYGLQDVVRLRQMVDESSAGDEHKRIERYKLDALLGWCETTTCRRRPLLEYFGEATPADCGNCDNCLDPPRTWDASEDAQKLLSCIYRTGQRFGAAHVIDVLRGIDSDKVRQHRHQDLSTYALGAHASLQHWRSLLRQLMVRGYVIADVERYGALRLTPGARDVLRGAVSFEVREDIAVARGAARKQKSVHTDLAVDAELFDRLRALRKRLAEHENVPPYVIFHDRSLQEMAARRPATAAEFLATSGVGQAKLARYGAAFMSEIAAQRAGGSEDDVK